MSTGKLLWCLILTLSLSTTLFDGTWEKNLEFMSNITLWMVLQNIFIVALIVGAAFGLIKLQPIFKKSLFSLFEEMDRKDDGKGDEEKDKIHGNINLIPMKIKYFGLVFLALIVINLPSLAMLEENWFRAGTEDWINGLGTSFVFGMVHCLLGVPIGAGVAITISGIWYTHQYFLGGVELSALHHTTYNLIVMTVLFVILAVEHVQHFKKKISATAETTVKGESHAGTGIDDH